MSAATLIACTAACLGPEAAQLEDRRPPYPRQENQECIAVIRIRSGAVVWTTEERF